MRRNHGFTLIEVLVVIVILGILLSIATQQFSSMTQARNIAKEAQQLLTDLYSVRTQAMFSKQRTTVSFPTGSSYAFARYSSNDETGPGKTTSTTGVKYALSAGNGSSLVGKTLIFDREGMAAWADGTPLSTPLTIMVNPSNSGASADCVAIDTARTSVGRMVNGGCVFK